MRLRFRWIVVAGVVAVLPIAACSSVSTPSGSAAAGVTTPSPDSPTATADSATGGEGSSAIASSADGTADSSSAAPGSVALGAQSDGGSFNPCALLTQDQIRQQVGGSPSAGQVDPNDSQHCIWQVPGSRFLTTFMKASNETVEVGLSMGTPIDRAGFDGVSKQVGNTPVSGVGDTAYFNSTLYNVNFLIGGQQYDVEMPLIGADSPEPAEAALIPLAKEAAAKL